MRRQFAALGKGRVKSIVSRYCAFMDRDGRWDRVEKRSDR
ncbi:hypothetical protein KCP78_18515 [Salmonella enterica subsp. enterica]|nr:hypothetical protein KCP78_18515 [Salmonella enterica subsp. enterica]